ncbi:ArsR/SmtB family transcription factor [Gracilibacillus thailandensis]|uniref:Metalloregulator ArsR/SmtB family transcription factor n=1 Tax=Gracilibacillus thailandensis TaxID=563735 RepID=A0A6N7QVB1_9BACI|nr:metalloregulator ArsR/SmtB family transcription factor [Gracilibacillus thailandensis]MRI65948.1 metalloregulator ArsR/SmtB family transcription factor [Gracilibacillus thailandensis]
MINQENEQNLVYEFKKNQDILFAIGDQTRQAILITLMQGLQHPGMRVGEITAKTHLSRPTVSHHLKILKDAKIINVHKEGTMNYYHLDSKSRLKLLKNLIDQIEKIFLKCEAGTIIRSKGTEGENDCKN